MALSTKSRHSDRLPSWLRRRIPLLSECAGIESVVRRYSLHTVCREALCPNRAECYSKGKVTFMILGCVCTRGCRFCSVRKGNPLPPDENEPENISRAAMALGLKNVIITSVTRDDLPDGGSSHYASVIRALKEIEPAPTIEVLIPDFGGDLQALGTVLEAGPDILSHNMETVERLYRELRVGADYGRSLRVLEEAKKIEGKVMTKSSFILGLGETLEEVMEAFRDLRRVGCDFLAVGQYLRPSIDQVPASEFISPERFGAIESEAKRLGFLEVASGPLVRSSYQENRLGVHTCEIPFRLDE